MKVVINQQSLEWSNGAPIETFGHLMNRIYGSELPPGHVITRLSLNGEELGIEEESASMDRLLKEITSVEVESRSADEVLKEGLETSEATLDQLKLNCETCVQAIQGKDLKSAGESLTEATSLIQWMLHLTNSLESMAPPKDPTALRELKVEFDRILRELHANIESGAFAELARTLELKFIPQLGGWKKLFQEVRNGMA